jgi:hypothetical protein
VFTVSTAPTWVRRGVALERDHERGTYFKLDLR